LVRRETATALASNSARTHKDGRVPAKAAPAGNRCGVGRLQRNGGALTEHGDERGASAPEVARESLSHAGEHGLRDTLKKGVG